MPFQEGHKLSTGNPNISKEGRAKGTGNKLTRENREDICNYVLENKKQFQRRMNSLNDIDYCNVYIKLLPYAASKVPREDSGEKNKGTTTIIFKAREKRQLDNIQEAEIIKDETNSN